MIASVFVVMTILGSASLPNQSTAAPPAPAPIWNASDYYVTGRYTCLDNDDNSARGSCDLTTHANSCDEAVQAQRAAVAAVDDICKHCTANVTDNTKHRSPDPVVWIHAGPCQGSPSN